MNKICEKCKWRRWIKTWYSNKFKRWIKNPLVIPVILFLVVIMFLWNLDKINVSNGTTFSFLTILIGFLGLIFAGLKYKLDQANYHKDLFEKRYRIFVIVNEILSDCLKDKTKNWREFAEKMISIRRESYFLFSNETVQFINKVCEAVIKISAEPNFDKHYKEQEFLANLLDNQNLAKNFPELKIDFY